MLDTIEQEILNNHNPTYQQMQLGDELYFANVYGLYYITKTISTDATGELAVTIPFACEILDVEVQANAASVAGTLTLKAGSNAITDAIICAVDTTIVKAGTIDDTYSTLAAGATVTVDAHGAGDKGLMTILVRRV